MALYDHGISFWEKYTGYHEANNHVQDYYFALHKWTEIIATMFNLSLLYNLGWVTGGHASLILNLQEDLEISQEMSKKKFNASCSCTLMWSLITDHGSCTLLWSLITHVVTDHWSWILHSHVVTDHSCGHWSLITMFHTIIDQWFTWDIPRLKLNKWKELIMKNNF
jgi:hypothetical protein